MNEGFRLAIAGTGSYLPKRVVTNSEFIGRDLFAYNNCNKVGEARRFTEKGIIEVTGVHERRYSDMHETAAFMGYQAGRIALEKANIDPNDIQGIFFATNTDGDFPGGAPYVAEKLGIKPSFALGIRGACAGAILGIIQASATSLLVPGNYLVIGSEQMTSMIRKDDINSTLFGDGAGAVVLTPDNSSRGLIAFDSKCDSLEGRLGLIYRDDDYSICMPNGTRVLKDAVRSMVDSSRRVKEKAKWEQADVYIPHQANSRILDNVESQIEDSGAIVYKTIGKYGNMSTATCLVALDEALEDGTVRRSTNDREGSKVVMVSFGAGELTASVAVQF